MKKLIFFILISNSAFASSEIKTYDEAKSLADKTEANPKYREHQWKFLVPYFASNYAAVLQDCFAKTKEPDNSTFNMVLVIKNTGEVEKIYRDKDTNIGNCMFTKLEKETFPPPIVSPYHLHIEMSFTE